MKALAYLLGARALDVARDANRRQVEEVPLEPLATTEATAAAWRRWSLAGAASADATEHRRQRSIVSSEPRRTPV